MEKEKRTKQSVLTTPCHSERSEESNIPQYRAWVLQMLHAHDKLRQVVWHDKENGASN
jgi:hypothetical protein